MTYFTEVRNSGPETYHRPTMADVRQSERFGGTYLEAGCICGPWHASERYGDSRLRADALRSLAGRFVEEHLTPCLQLESEVAKIWTPE